MPEGFAAQPQAPLVLLHEYTHHRRRDLRKKLLLQGAVCLHWWNPAVWLLNRQAQQELELACDEGVLAVTGTAASAEYGRALLAAAAGRAPCMVSQFGSEKHRLKARLANLFRTGKRRGVAVVLACLLAGAGAGLLVACNGANGTGDTTGDTLTAETGTASDTEPGTNGNRFLDWYFTTDQNGRYHNVQEKTKNNSPALAEALETEYYAPAESFAVPELVATLREEKKPYRFDQTAGDVGVRVKISSCVLSEPQDALAAFKVNLKIYGGDDNYVVNSVTGQLHYAGADADALVDGITLQNDNGWPVAMMGMASAEQLPGTSETATGTGVPELDPQKMAVVEFMRWYLSGAYSYAQTRYQACVAQEKKGTESFAEVLQQKYYDRAADFATPELVEQMSANREPYRFDQAADELGLQCLPTDYQVEATDKADTYRFTMQMRMVRADGGYTISTLTGQAWLDGNTKNPRVKTFQFNKKDGWPATVELLNATPEGIGSQKLHYLVEPTAPGTIPAPRANAVRVMGTANESLMVGNTQVNARLADLPQVVSVEAKETYGYSLYSRIHISAYALEPGSYTVNTGAVVQLGGASSCFYYYGMSVDGFAGTSPQIGLLKTDGTVMYLLGTPEKPLTIDGDGNGSYTHYVELANLPEGEYLVAFINSADSSTTLSAELNCGPIIVGENSSTFLNTRSEEGNVRADIDVVGNRKSRVISEIPALKIRSADGLTALEGTITDTVFDDKTLTMTVYCHYTGTDTNGKTQEGTATFKVAYP